MNRLDGAQTFLSNFTWRHLAPEDQRECWLFCSSENVLWKTPQIRCIGQRIGPGPHRACILGKRIGRRMSEGAG